MAYRLLHEEISEGTLCSHKKTAWLLLLSCSVGLIDHWLSSPRAEWDFYMPRVSKSNRSFERLCFSSAEVVCTAHDF